MLPWRPKCSLCDLLSRPSNGGDGALAPGEAKFNLGGLSAEQTGGFALYPLGSWGDDEYVYRSGGGSSSFLRHEQDFGG